MDYAATRSRGRVGTATTLSAARYQPTPCRYSHTVPWYLLHTPCPVLIEGPYTPVQYWSRVPTHLPHPPYRATRSLRDIRYHPGLPLLQQWRAVYCYGVATHCPVLNWGMLLWPIGSNGATRESKKGPRAQPGVAPRLVNWTAKPKKKDRTV
eukprot:3917477-Rhodomonas_salina.1